MNIGVLSAHGIAKLDFYNQIKNNRNVKSGAIKNAMIYRCTVGFSFPLIHIRSCYKNVLQRETTYGQKKDNT